MPLHDHFRPPLGVRRHWHAFHNAWATYLASDLNRRLPEGYFAEANVQFGIEIDVAAFEEAGQGGSAEPIGAWTPPAPSLILPLALLTDVVEVQVFAGDGGPTLAGAIELVSPANKDRPAQRDAFISKCAAYVQQALGLVVVDVVTSRTADLHKALLARLDAAGDQREAGGLFAAAYRPVQHDGQPELQVWRESVSVGQPLPTLPLWLRGGLCLPAELEATYERTCQEQRILVNGA